MEYLDSDTPAVILKDVELNVSACRAQAQVLRGALVQLRRDVESHISFNPEVVLPRPLKTKLQIRLRAASESLICAVEELTDLERVLGKRKK